MGPVSVSPVIARSVETCGLRPGLLPGSVTEGLKSEINFGVRLKRWTPLMFCSVRGGLSRVTAADLCRG